MAPREAIESGQHGNKFLLCDGIAAEGVEYPHVVNARLLDHSHRLALRVFAPQVEHGWLFLGYWWGGFWLPGRIHSLFPPRPLCVIAGGISGSTTICP